MKNKDIVSNPHDRFFKKVMSDSATAAELIKTYAPSGIVQLADFASLELISGSFIDVQLQQKETDLLFKANFGCSQGYFYILLEHQSTPDSKMPLRCARYVALIQEQHMEEHKTIEIPYVFPLVLYNGKKRYRYSTDVREMLMAPKELVDEYRMGQFHLVDLNVIKDEDLRTSTWNGLCLYVMKHVFDREISEIIEHFIQSFRYCQVYFDGAELISRQTLLLNYIMSSYRNFDVEVFMRELQKSSIENADFLGKTMAEQLEERGLKKGIQRGIQQGEQSGRDKEQCIIVNNMLARGLTADEIYKLTNISVQKILAIESGRVVQ